jgi:UDP-3-O-acyl N-acetylglucosamine deacetylase
MSTIAEQTTLARAVTKRGVGLHTGAEASLSLLPAAPDSGLVFVTETGVQIPAIADSVVSTERATALGLGDSQVRAVEHVLAALYGMGIDNARLELEGPEVPACDGSAKEWVLLLREAGRRRLARPRRTTSLPAAVWAGEGGGWAMALPARAGLSLAVAVDFSDTVAGRQAIWLPSAPRRFAAELAPARTFAFEHELEQLRAAGLARGGAAGNAFTVGREAYSGPLRFPDEVVRHKALDLMGDLALCGHRLGAQVVAVRPGHRTNVALAKAIRAALLESPRALPGN